MSTTEQHARIAVSPITGAVYEVFEYEELDDGKLISESKRELDRGEAPREALHAAARQAYDPWHKDRDLWDSGGDR
jgi:hypothetical protein